jgi:hypothetical protein
VRSTASLQGRIASANEFIEFQLQLLQTLLILLGRPVASDDYTLLVAVSVSTPCELNEPAHPLVNMKFRLDSVTPASECQAKKSNQTSAVPAG